MSWLILILSGSGSRLGRCPAPDGQASGRRRIAPASSSSVSVLASTGGLAIAMQSIPTGTAYAVWVGVGVVLTSAYAMLTKAERPTTARLLLLTGIAACVVGLKMVAA